MRGGWVPMAKSLVEHLPKRDPFRPVEAAFQVQVDFDNGNEVTLSGYASQWRWGKNRVRRFLNAMGVTILYPEGTGKTQNQRGILHQSDNSLIAVRKQSDNGLINFFDSSDLGRQSDRSQSETSLKPVRKRVATIDPNPKTVKPLADFDEFWSQYPKKIGKAAAGKSWRKIKPSAELHQTILAAVSAHKTTDQWTKDGGKFIPHPATWLNQRRWEDEIETPSATHRDTDVDAEHARAANAVAREFGL